MNVSIDKKHFKLKYVDSTIKQIYLYTQQLASPTLPETRNIYLIKQV